MINIKNKKKNAIKYIFKIKIDVNQIFVENLSSRCVIRPEKIIDELLMKISV